MKLREELFTLDTDNPTMDELNSFPYLDAVVRESLRIHSPIATVMRQAASDDILPLDTPFKGKDGRLHRTLR
jgi:cytochrome P450